MRCKFAALRHGLSYRPGGGDVVVFDHNATAQIESMAITAAALHGVMIEFSHSSQDFARIDEFDLRPEKLRHRMCLRRYTTHVLKEIERRALGLEQDIRRS